MYIPVVVFAGGNREQTKTTGEKELDVPIEDTDAVIEDIRQEIPEPEIIVPAATPTFLSYTPIVSNNGTLYKFQESSVLPPEAVLGQLNIQNVDTRNPHIANFSAPIQPGTQAFEYILNAKPNTFYPQVPLVATLTLVDKNSQAIRTSETDFITKLTLTHIENTEPSLYQSEPILFSYEFIGEQIVVEESIETEESENETHALNDNTIYANNLKTVTLPTNKDYFAKVYKTEDLELLKKFLTQITHEIKKYPNDRDVKYVLITGINVNSDFNAETYKRLFNKVSILRQALIKYNQNTSTNINVSVDVALYMKNSDKHKTNLYPQMDQAIVSVTDQEKVIQEVKQAHREQSINFYKEASKILHTKYRSIQDRLDTIRNNMIVTQREYLQSEQYLKLSTADTTLERANRLEEQIDVWMEKTQKIQTSLERVRVQLNSLNRSRDGDKSLNSVMDMMNSNGVNDSTLLNGLVTLQAGYDDTYNRISEIEDEYNRRITIVGINRSSNLAYINMLEEFTILLDYQEKILHEENNQFLLNNFSVLLADIESIYSDIPKTLNNNVNNDDIEIPALISGIQKVESLLIQLEDRIIEISNMLAKKSEEANRNIIVYHSEKNTEAGITNNIKDSIEDERESVDLEKIDNTESIDLEDSDNTLANIEGNTDTGEEDEPTKTEIVEATTDVGEEETTPPIVGSSFTNIRNENDYVNHQLNMIPLDKKIYTRIENITNGISNIIAVSEQLKLRNSLAQKIYNINQATDSIQIHYYIIQAKVFPIIHISDKDLMTQTINRERLSAPAIAPTISQEPEYPTIAEKRLFEEVTEHSFSIPLETHVVVGFDEDKAKLQNIFTTEPEQQTSETLPQKNTLSIPAEKTTPPTPSYNESEYNVLGQGTLPKSSIIAYINSKQANPVANVHTLVDYYITEANKEGVNADLAIAQMLYNTHFIGVKKFFGKNNPIGIGGPSRKNWEIYPFSHIQLGVRAHIQHLKAYSTSEPIKETIVDPRYNILKDSGLIGSASTIKEISASWYGSDDASNAIITILDEMKSYR